MITLKLLSMQAEGWKETLLTHGRVTATSDTDDGDVDFASIRFQCLHLYITYMVKYIY
jgi:hypothetical protein